MIKILIVDDHYIVREGIRLILELEDDYEVIGEAENGQQALAFLEKQTPDLILLDINMPILDGISFLKKLHQLGKQIPVIILTTYNEDQFLVEATELGVSSYLLKDTGRETIYETINAVMDGQSFFPPDIQQQLIEAQSKLAENTLLTAKEIKILQALARGLKNSEIASEMFLSERTVKGYLTIIYEKLHVKSRAQAIAVAIEKKYI